MPDPEKKKGQWGGARAGGGRKKNALTVTRREDAVTATTEIGGLTPIQVMARNMYFYFELAESLTEKLAELRVDVKEPETVKELLKTINKMMDAREKAQACASDMAPYRHPRLASIEVSANFDEAKTVDLQKTLPAVEAFSRYADYMKSKNAQRTPR